MDISAIQAKLLLSQIGGAKELTKANVAQNTKVIQKEQKKGTDSKYTENEINDRADISQEAVSRFYNEMDKNVNDSMENNNYDKNSQTTTIIHFKIQMPICTKELVELIKGHARFLNSRLLKPV